MVQEVMRYLLPIVLVVAALSSCGDPTEVGPSTALFSYHSDCIFVDSEVELRPESVVFYISSARSIFERKFGKGSFCGTFSGQAINVSANTTVPCVGPTNPDSDTTKPHTCTGGTDIFGTVTVARDGRPVLHELFHVWDQKHIRPGTMWHEGWKEAGLFDLDDEYSRTVSTPQLGGFWAVSDR